jgi:hypothetical protein
MSHHRVKLSFLGLLLLAAPSFAQKVYVDWDPDFAGPTETYAWAVAKDTAQNPLVQQRIVNAIDYWMTMRGHREVTPEENPNVILVYHTNTQDQVVVTSDSFGYGYGPGFRWGGGMGSTTSRSHTYTKGTLVVDVWEPKEKKLVFRGTATDTVDADPEKLEKKINKMVEKMVEEFDEKLEEAEKEKKKSS